MIKIHVKNAANLNPDPLYAKIKFNHPELVERLRALGYISQKKDKGYEELREEV